MKFIYNTHCSLSFLLPCPDLFVTHHIYFGKMLRNAFIAPQNSHTLHSTFCLIVTTSGVPRGGLGFSNPPPEILKFYKVKLEQKMFSVPIPTS
jgi:hypothetical protein